MDNKDVDDVPASELPTRDEANVALGLAVANEASPAGSLTNPRVTPPLLLVVLLPVRQRNKSLKPYGLSGVVLPRMSRVETT